MSEEIVNRVANSSLVNLDLEDFLPKENLIEVDMVQFLFEGLILREKDFRAQITEKDWNVYSDKAVVVYCSTDAIIPNWAYMLLASELKKVNATPYFGTQNEVKEKILMENFISSDLSIYDDSRVLVKGCGSIDLSPQAYLKVTTLLQDKVKSLMFGEACSNVPVFKKK